MKKCKCLKCGGIYDLPQPKTCPACGGIKFQSYFIKDPSPAKPASKTTASVPPAARPAAKPIAPPAARPAASRRPAPSKPPATPSAATATSATARKTRTPIGARIKDFCSWVICDSWNQRVERICRIGGLLVAAAIFTGTFCIPWIMFGGWYWGVIALVVMIFFVKK